VSDDPLIPEPDALIGAMVGDYQVIEPVGEGGMGVVYRGVQPVIKKRVAIKVLKPQVAGDEQQVRRLISEAESVNAIGHRGIIDIFGLGTLPDGRPYIVMEFLEGEALDVWLQRQPGGRVPLLTALELLLEVCAPLSAAHRANVIHRDLKPSNVFICRQADGTRFLKILDFGLAKRAVGLDGNTKQTSQSVVSGTPDYMAPEQARGLSISPRSDVYALGVMAFELFTGRVPFTGATPMDVMVAHVGSPPPSPRALEPSLPEELDALVLRMLAKAPEARPQTVEEARTGFEDAVVLLGNPRPRSSREMPAFVPSTASSQPSLPPMFSQTPNTASPAAAVSPRTPAAEAVVQPRSKVGLWIGLVVVLGLLGAGTTWVLTRPDQADRVKLPVPVPIVAMVDPPMLLEADAGDEFDAGAAMAVVVEPVDAGTVSDELDAGVMLELVDASDVKPVKGKAAPTARQLKDRITRLSARAKKKKDLDPTALQFLGRYRIEAAAADSAARRQRLDKALTDWERTFLRK
jgi:serine/threonine protein kinase